MDDDYKLYDGHVVKVEDFLHAQIINLSEGIVELHALAVIP